MLRVGVGWIGHHCLMSYSTLKIKYFKKIPKMAGPIQPTPTFNKFWPWKSNPICPIQPIGHHCLRSYSTIGHLCLRSYSTCPIPHTPKKSLIICFFSDPNPHLITLILKKLNPYHTFFLKILLRLSLSLKKC